MCSRPSGLFRRAKREEGAFSFHTVFDDDDDDNNAFCYRHGTNTTVIEFPVRIVSYDNTNARAQIENIQTHTHTHIFIEINVISQNVYCMFNRELLNHTSLTDELSLRRHRNN